MIEEQFLAKIVEMKHYHIDSKFNTAEENDCQSADEVLTRNSHINGG
jgi:hypothetical protein